MISSGTANGYLAPGYLGPCFLPLYGMDAEERARGCLAPWGPWVPGARGRGPVGDVYSPGPLPPRAPDPGRSCLRGYLEFLNTDNLLQSGLLSTVIGTAKGYLEF